MNTKLTSNETVTKRAINAPLTMEELNRIPGNETKAKRTRNGKIFNLGRNFHQAVLFAEPVHYRDKTTGEWEEIDNTFVPVTDDAGSAYLTNRANDEFKVELHPASNVATITMQDDEDHLLAWRLEDAGDVAPAGVDPPAHECSECDLHRDVLEHTESSALYPDVFPGVDLHCTVRGLSFKDALIFATSESVRPVAFTLSAPGLQPRRQENGDIVFFDTNDETVYTLPAPFLRDSAEESLFGDVRCELAAADEPDTWRLTYTPDAAWIASAQFPVVLDPVVITKKHSSAIEDNFVTSAKPNTVQPYAGTGMTVSQNSSNWGTSIAFIKFLGSGLPAIDSSYYVTKAYFSVMTKSAPTSAASIYLKEALGDWSSQTITYNSAPALSEKALDYAYMTAGNTWYTYDISNLVRKWYGGTNYGFALEAGSPAYLELFTSDQAYYKPHVIINYVSIAGVADYLAYEDQEVGRAGVGHVSLYNGNLIFERKATASSGSRMPVSVNQVYNSCYRNETAFCMGAGWKTNLQQALYRETLEGPDGATLYYVYLNASGTKIHFRQVSGVWKDQAGLDMTLTLSGSTATITDKADQTLVFDLPTVEFAGNYANAKMLKSISDACGNTASLASSGSAPLSATDGVGRLTTFSTSFGRTDNGSRNACLIGTIFSPAYPDVGACGFTYDANERLTTVWVPSDGAFMDYAYDANGLLISAANRDGMQVTYEYYTDREPYRVRRARILNGALVGFDHTYEYGDCLTVVTDNLGGKKLFYHFNDDGNCVSVNDQLGYALFAKYAPGLPVNHPETVSHLQKSIVNLLPNHNFEADSDWIPSRYDGEGDVTYTTDQRYLGTRSLQMHKTGGNGNLHAYLPFYTLTVGQTYTFSCYLRRSGSATAYISVSQGADWVNSELIGTGEDWTRVTSTFTAASTSAQFYLITLGVGDAWFDCAQLEEGPTANSYNLLINGDFTFNVNAAPAGWLANSTNATQDQVYPAFTGEKPAGLSANTLRLYGGGRTKYPGVYQDISQSGSKGDVYVAGGWSLGYSMPRKGEEFRYDIRVAFLKAGTSTRENAPSIEWSEEWTDWQFAAGPVVAPCDYTAIRFNVDYEHNINYAEFGGFFLYKEQFGQSFVYDSRGNVLSSTDAAGLKDGATYDSFNNIVSYVQTGRPATVKTTLDWGATDAEKKKHLLRRATRPLGTSNDFNYDAYGNQTVAKTWKVGEADFIQTATGYDDNANHVTAQADARGQMVRQTVNPSLDTLTSVTDPQGQTVKYAYDSSRRITQTSAATPSGTYRNNYAYTRDLLTQVRHNTSAGSADDVVYSFFFDPLDRPTRVWVGNQELSLTTYNPDATVEGVTYGNGGRVVNRYDAFKRLVGVRFDDETSDQFTYVYGANGEVAQVTDNARSVTVRSEYDAANRPMRKTIMKYGTEHAYTGTVTYDQYNNLATFTEQQGPNYTHYGTSFAYDAENRPIELSYEYNRKVYYAYDDLGRIATRIVNAGNAALVTNYTYVPGGYGTGSTSPLVETISQPTGNLIYGYDANGNIVYVSNGSQAVAYAYDAIGQLIRVNDPFDPTAGSSGTTWIYTYDLGGNILSKTAYAYSAGAIGAPVQTDTYAYTDPNWKDKLTTYNGVPITYDAIGNPLNDGTWSYTWEHGRQLRSMSRSNEAVSFLYNEDGLRVQKTATSTSTTEYTLHGKNIVHLTRGSDFMHFFYDAQNKPAMVAYNGLLYSYAYNLQGDVIALLNANGTVVVEYRYDAWGKPISKTGLMADTLGTLNPFRYRGYVYDEETGLYYLRSRYYNPTWCRLVNADSILTRNLFAYCNNNPICSIDENGQLSTYAHMIAMAMLHDEVARRVARAVGGFTARSYTRIKGAGRHGGDGFPDVISGWQVWEVKPYTAYGKKTGRRQMAKYTSGTGYVPGRPVNILPFSWTLEGTKGMVHIISGCAQSTEAGVIYYMFVPDPQRQEETAPETETVTEEAPAYAYSYEAAPLQQTGWTLASLAGAFLIALFSPIPGDEIVFGGALFWVIP